MRYRSLGRSGLVVSVAGLGGNNFGRRLDVDAARAVVDAAIDAGVTLLDTADSYGAGRSEEILGEVLAGRRDQVVLATKFGHRNADLGYGAAAGARAGAGISCGPSSGRCAACGPITSTSTRSTRPTRPPRSRRRSPR